MERRESDKIARGQMPKRRAIRVARTMSADQISASRAAALTTTFIAYE
jgi:hypothetical protein